MYIYSDYCTKYIFYFGCTQTKVTELVIMLNSLDDLYKDIMIDKIEKKKEEITSTGKQLSIFLSLLGLKSLKLNDLLDMRLGYFLHIATG